MQLHLAHEKGVPIQPGMIGLFFEDINYAADGGLYAEMIENRSFEFLDCSGTVGDYYTTHDCGYGGHPTTDFGEGSMAYVMGSPVNRVNPHYLHSLGGQGYAHDSSWTRGQGWGVYGFMISYRHTGEMSYLRTAERIADTIVPHIPESGIIPVDFCQPAQPAWEDSCGACVIAGGLLELAKAEIIPAQKRALYLGKALRILHAIDEKRADWSEGCDSIVLGCSGAYHNRNHHFTMVCAGCYFVEAIARLRGSRLRMW